MMSTCRLALLVAILSCPACGTADPDRVEISGAVTYNGLPIDRGTIMFDPDTSRGNTAGVQGSATIANGRYVIEPKRGPGTGPYIARVTGYQGPVPTDPEKQMLSPDGDTICMNAPVPIEISGDGNIDIAVSAQKVGIK